MSRKQVKASKWFDMEGVGFGGKGFLVFALQEVQEVKKWTLEMVEADKIPREFGPEWKAAQLRRKYLAGKPILHTVPGGIFERAILDTLKRTTAGEEEDEESWNTFFLRLREGWVRDRNQEAGAQKFSFTGEVKEWVQGPQDKRTVSPERAEYQLFYEHELEWKWGCLRLSGDVEKSIKSTLHHWHIPWRGGGMFFSLVEDVQIRQVRGEPEKWQLRLNLK